MSIPNIYKSSNKPHSIKNINKVPPVFISQIRLSTIYRVLLAVTLPLLTKFLQESKTGEKQLNLIFVAKLLKMKHSLTNNCAIKTTPTVLYKKHICVSLWKSKNFLRLTMELKLYIQADLMTQLVHLDHLIRNMF